MNTKISICLVFCIALIIGCSKDSPVKESAQSEQSSDVSNAKKATRVSGVAYYADATECDYEGKGATYATKMTGDLEGCYYVWIDEYHCSGDGNYFEKGHELFVGTYKGQPGSFQTTYRFVAKFPGCKDGGPMGIEIFGLCQHPIVEGSGDGVFAGVTGILHFWDNIPAGKFPYRGQLRF